MLNYEHAHALLCEHARVDKKRRNTEIEDILSYVVYSYFSRYDFTAVKETHHRAMASLCEDNDFGDFENSEIGHAVTMAVIEETAHHLPGFVSHNSHHCAKIYDLRMSGMFTLLITTDWVALDLFGVKRAKTFLAS